MVLGPIIKEVFRLAVKYGSRYYAAEGKAFNKLYRGFPQSKTIGRGVRHGLTGGSVIGSFITDSGDSPGNGVQKTFTKQSPPRKSYKARGRYSKRNYCRNPGKRTNNAFGRYSRYR